MSRPERAWLAAPRCAALCPAALCPAALCPEALCLAALCLAVLGLAALAGCAHVEAPDPDRTLQRLERAYTTLRAGGSHAKARRDLELAAQTFEDLALPGTSLEEALASDPHKPYRGRPWERTLSLVLLAALDAERGRCDLAVPALKSAALLDLREQRGQASDAPVIYALLLRCLRDIDAPDDDLARARVDLQQSLHLAGASVSADQLEQRALAPHLALAFDGEAPTLASAGRYGESAVLRVDAAAAARPQVALAVPERGALVVRIGEAAHQERPGERQGLMLWTTARQAGTINGRPFDEVLRQRAELKGQAMREGERLVGDGLQRARAPGALLGAAATTAAGAGLFAAGAVLDARADTRFVSSLFGRVVLLD